uniref:Uncharacterized protein n=1 Tax=Timema genevievae TaxID=629358 RepID=A0A7R9PIJ9_TIMGE|nr:unnamed protein product [Timema genevievae]
MGFVVLLETVVGPSEREVDMVDDSRRVCLIDLVGEFPDVVRDKLGHTDVMTHSIKMDDPTDRENREVDHKFGIAQFEVVQILGKHCIADGLYRMFEEERDKGLDETINPVPLQVLGQIFSSIRAHQAGSQLARPCSKLVRFGPDQSPVSRQQPTWFLLGFNPTSTRIGLKTLASQLLFVGYVVLRCPWCVSCMLHWNNLPITGHSTSLLVSTLTVGTWTTGD